MTECRCEDVDLPAMLQSRGREIGQPEQRSALISRSVRNKSYMRTPDMLVPLPGPSFALLETQSSIASILGNGLPRLVLRASFIARRRFTPGPDIMKPARSSGKWLRVRNSNGFVVLLSDCLSTS